MTVSFFQCLITRCKKFSPSCQVIIYINQDKTIISCRIKPHTTPGVGDWQNELKRPVWQPGFPWQLLAQNQCSKIVSDKAARKPNWWSGCRIKDGIAIGWYCVSISKFKWEIEGRCILNLLFFQYYFFKEFPCFFLSFKIIKSFLRRTATTVKLLT